MVSVRIAADPGYFGAEHSGDLHSEGPHAAGGAIVDMLERQDIRRAMLSWTIACMVFT